MALTRNPPDIVGICKDGKPVAAGGRKKGFKEVEIVHSDGSKVTSEYEPSQKHIIPKALLKFKWRGADCSHGKFKFASLMKHQ